MKPVQTSTFLYPKVRVQRHLHNSPSLVALYRPNATGGHYIHHMWEQSDVIHV